MVYWGKRDSNQNVKCPFTGLISQHRTHLIWELTCFQYHIVDQWRNKQFLKPYISKMTISMKWLLCPSCYWGVNVLRYLWFDWNKCIFYCFELVILIQIHHELKYSVNVHSTTSIIFYSNIIVEWFLLEQFQLMSLL